MITSVKENEGKSTISINLAKNLSESRCKVLYIDADTRKSSLASRFRFEGKLEGLSSYLSGNSNIEDIIYATDVDNLNIIPAGQVPPNPGSLLQTENFDAMLEAFKKYYDYIIIDTPPIFSVVDAAIVAKKSDGFVIVTQAGLNKRKSIKKAKEQLEKSGSKFLGIVLNKFNTEKSTYGEYGNYGK